VAGRRTTSPRAILGSALAGLIGIGASPSAVSGQVRSTLGDCIETEGARLTGRVVEQRTRLALPGARVRLAFQDGRAESHTAEADDGGVFFFCGLDPSDRVELVAEFQGKTSGTRRVPAGSGDALTLEVDLGELAYLILSVSDSRTGRPVPGVTIRLEPLALGGITDGTGRVKLSAVPPGQYRIRADHIAFTTVDEAISIGEGEASELRVQLVPRVIALEPLAVKITRRDPYLVSAGFYDRMASVEDARFFTYWEVEPYYKLSTFLQFKKELFIRGRGEVFVNGRPLRRMGYESVDELPFGKVRGVEWVRCRDLPREALRFMKSPTLDCHATLVWVGDRRVRDDQSPPARPPR